MSVLIFAESNNGKFNKATLEVASYAKAVASSLGTSVSAVAINANDSDALAQYGVEKILNVNNTSLENFNGLAYADVIKQAAEKVGASLVVMSSTTDGKFLSPLVACNLNAGYASNVVALPESTSPFTVKRTAFSNKAFNITELTSDNKVIALAKNAFGLQENQVTITEESFEPTLNDAHLASKVESVDKVTGTVTIADAEIVVSGGRGLKGPENWGMVEDLAATLGAATACSKPVSDLGWRPHSEHVGQTGKPVASNLYIAIGISGAIQHLAGINSSKVKVVINTDPEAPFFKAADYGIVGDAFEVVPKLNEKLKAFKAQNA
ncbi:electron transfer flavoprotein subunit alpha/FixB family protein [Pseudofulvibacter geojedonensis]|uniref:Electron transfer flavoprotein subunit alpha/FixB family protein n=1 Tax=Pseudofulvibacter geojedonensis TaxID=1123758 RepID=A0ABW3I5E3_9FLAO